MQTSERQYREYFHRDGVEAWLTCGGNSCLLEFSLPWDAESGGAPRALVEVLWQPRNERGLPEGAAITLLRETVDLRMTPDLKRAAGRLWLTSVSPSLATRSHLRVRPLQ